ncbi:MAG: hypothetical protein KDD94_04160 [Calditrichaeota bacterium]|nr:hypothetical protein [Calditrichota bacterium]
MRKQLKFILLISLIACDSGKPIGSGRVQGLSYENIDAGVAIDLPENWSIIHDHETFKLISQEILSEAEYRRKWESALAKPLVACYKYKDHIVSNAVINPNIMVSTEYIPPRSGIKTEAEYLENYKNALKQHKQRYTFGDSRIIDTGSFKFTSLSMTFELEGISISKQSLLYKSGDQLLNFTLTWETDDQETFNHMWQSFLTTRLILKQGNE